MKNDGNKYLDQLLKDKLAEGSANVPEMVWDNIEAELFPKKKRRGLFWWFFGGIGAFLLVTFIATGSYGNKVPEQRNYASAQNNQAAQNSEQKNAKSGLSAKSEVSGSDKTSSAIENPAASAVNIKSSASSAKTGSEAKTTGKHLVPETLIASARNSNGDYDGAKANGKRSGRQQPRSIPIVTAASGKTTSSAEPSNDIRGSELTDKTDVTTDPPETVNDQSDKTSAVDTLPYRMVALGTEEQSPVSWNKPVENKGASFFSVGLYGGPSFYDIAVFRDYFSSGQLSRRSFASSGFEAGINANFRIGDRFGVYAGLAFNRKQSMFRYNLGITTEDYFEFAANGLKIPLANIHDGSTNNCFLAENATAEYTINTTLLSAGTTFELLRFGKFSAAADLRISMNIQSAMKLNETRVIDIPAPGSERFSYFQPGAGILLSYKITDRFSVGLSPFYSKQFGAKGSFYHKLNELVVPVTVRIGF